jgi:O-antigen chain-terminating methyltransferase
MTDPKAWRDTLYRNYSTQFSHGKETNVALNFPLYEQAYSGVLPADKDGPVLDLGCGRGEWLLWLRSLGFTDLTGVDLSEVDLQAASANGLAVILSDVTRALETYEGRFSLIHAKDLIEHLDKNEAVEFAKAAYRALRPGGRLVVSTFNAQAPFASSTRYGDFTHETGFSPTSMAQWLHACGFSDVEIRGTHVCPSGLKGSLRRILYRIVDRFSCAIIVLRHGAQATGLVTCMPDLLGIAAKPR